MSSLPLTSSIDGVSVLNTSTLVLAANQTRTSAVFINDSDSVIYLALGTAAEANKGIRLNANGGSYEITANNHFPGTVFAICSSSGKNLCVTEVYGVPSAL